MPTYNIGPCGCCGEPPCDPVSFRFLSFVMSFAYEYNDPPWNTIWKTTCTLVSASVEITHRDGRVEIVDGVADGIVYYTSEFYSNQRRFYSQGYISKCGKMAQWYVGFPNQGNVDSYTGSLEDATQVTYGEFR